VPDSPSSMMRARDWVLWSQRVPIRMPRSSLVTASDGLEGRCHLGGQHLRSCTFIRVFPPVPGSDVHLRANSGPGTRCRLRARSTCARSPRFRPCSRRDGSRPRRGVRAARKPFPVDFGEHERVWPRRVRTPTATSAAVIRRAAARITVRFKTAFAQGRGRACRPRQGHAHPRATPRLHVPASRRSSIARSTGFNCQRIGIGLCVCVQRASELILYYYGSTVVTSASRAHPANRPLCECDCAVSSTRP
jgi:hypothetical protein